MKLDKLKIDKFKNLQDFFIDFDESPLSLTTVIVGRNGTGKSNLLEALIIIFRDLDLNAPPLFKYELDYVCHDRRVHVNADPQREKEAVQIKVDGEEISYKRFSQRGEGQLLPNYVFGYYSGPSNRMESHFEKHQEKFYKDLINNIEKPLRPLFYARLVHSQFVLLSFFTEQDQNTLSLLDEHLRIQSLDSVLFIMKEPEWAKSSGKRASADGDPRFWNARGVVRDFLSHLYSLALAPMRTEQRVKLGFGSQMQGFLYLYLTGTDALGKLASEYPNQQEFFKALESTYISDLISEVRIRVRTRNADGSLTFRELSEGEQQLLMVLGLLRFTKEEESLFLLDEPDTHLNPTWSVQYLELLRKFVGDQKTSHIIMTTHDPLVIAGLERHEVQIMQRDEEIGRIFADFPEENPRGMGVAALLTSDIYGLRSQLDLPTLRDLDDQRALAIKSNRTDEEEAKLQELTHKLDKLGFYRNIRDPLYEPYVNAMTAVQEKEKLQLPVLTKEQQERQQQLAFEIVRKLRAEQAEEIKES